MSLDLSQKTAWRITMRQRLRELDPGARAVRSREIVRRITASPMWRQATRVLLFAPLPVEPDLDLLWADGVLAGKQVAYPRVEGTTLRSYYVGGLDELQLTRWGLREPPRRAAREAMLNEFGLVLVPGLAFDAEGGRLGRGGGYYDRLLAPRDPVETRLVGVGFAFQRAAEPLPLAAHDVRMDEVCTD